LIVLCYNKPIGRFFSMEEMKGKVKKAYEMACSHHQRQVRKGSGEDYICHPLRVYELVARYTEDEDVLCAALLHDAVEDTFLDYDMIKSTLGKRVASLVEEVSTSKEDKKRLSWKRRKENTILSIYSLSKEAQLIEIADKIDNARSFENLLDENGTIHFDAFHEKDRTKQEWYYRELYSAFLKSAKSEEVLELASLFDEFISRGFNRSFASYQYSSRQKNTHFDFFHLRSLLSEYKEAGPVVIELIGTKEIDTCQMGMDLALDLRKYQITAEVASSYSSDLARLHSEEVISSIQKMKDKSKADILLVAGGLFDKKRQILNQFQEEKKKNPDIVYTVVEDLNTLREGEDTLVDGVLGIYEYNHFGVDQMDQYIDNCESFVSSMEKLADNLPQHMVVEDRVHLEAPFFILETAKATLEKKRDANSRGTIVKFRN